MLRLKNNSWTQLAIQLIGTVLILLFVPDDIGKLSSFLLLWALTFSPIKKSELIAFLLISLCMTFADIMAMKEGVFVFTNGPFYGIPYFETVLWGFYFMHWVRVFLKVQLPVLRAHMPFAVLAIGITFIILFLSTEHDTRTLYFSLLVLPIILFSLFKDWWGLFALGYGLFVGVIIELSGVLSGQWYYEGTFIGASDVPIWLFILWALIAWFVSRILFPLLYPRIAKK